MSLGSRNRIDFAGELGMGADGSRWDQVGSWDRRREHQERQLELEDIWVGWGGVETWFSGNSQDSMKMTPARTPRNEELANLYNQARFPEVGLEHKPTHITFNI